MLQPVFNLPEQSKALYCFEHKKENMINITSKNCQEEKCKKEALFGLINKRPQFCFEY